MFPADPPPGSFSGRLPLTHLGTPMQLQGDMIINGRVYPKGTDVAWYKIYPFFLLHMLVFGLSGFWMAYSRRPPPLVFLYLHGGFAILVYTFLYVRVFGRDEVKWMFINAALGLFGIYSQIGWLLSHFGLNADDFPWYRHAIPFLYYVLYTFLLRHAVLDLTQAREDPVRQKRAEIGYIAISIAIYVAFYFWENS